MKKGKTIKLSGYRTFKSHYGTIDSTNLKSIFINIQSWVEPKEEVENWNRVVLNMTRSIKHTVLENINKEVFDTKFIVDLDLRTSGIQINKKSFMNLEINFYLKKTELDFKSSYFKNYFKKLSKDINQYVLSNTEYFDLSISKSKKEFRIEY